MEQMMKMMEQHSNQLEEKAAKLKTALEKGKTDTETLLYRILPK